MNATAAAEPRGGEEEEETPVKMEIMSMVPRRSGWSRLREAPSSPGGRLIFGPIAGHEEAV